ncbi:Kynurenine 3-monooxygenase [Calothrix sp. NIES-4101]|nr:Kynurenine 3-monooxygenase [Calothrix sp. NIES-4101]
MSTPSNLSKVVIIGAGPAGLLLAHYLLQRGRYRVEIYERRSHPENTAKENRTFPISLQKRGQNAIQKIPGLADAIAQASVFCNGTSIHSQKRRTRQVNRKIPTQTIDRFLLVKTLLQHLQNSYDSQLLKISFDCKCVNIDEKAKQITLQSQLEDLQIKESIVDYDILVGADGSRSYVREYLIANLGWECEITYTPDDYKSIYFQRINPHTGFELAANNIHASGMGEKIRVILVPQPDDKLNGVIIFDASENPFTKFTSKEEIIDFFERNFPCFAPLIPDTEAETLLTRPPAKVLTVKCDRAHHGDSILLIGDALHAVSPSIGQGCNSALEDALIFAQLLDKNSDNWHQTLTEFSQQRIPDVLALHKLSNYALPRNKLLAGEFFIRLTLTRTLHRFFPKFVRPFVFDLVMDTDMPYSHVLKISEKWINKVEKSMQFAMRNS